MAATEAITQTINELEEVLASATNLAHCFNDATAHGEAPQWVYLFTRQIHQLDRKASQLIMDVNHKCMPLLREMESMTRTS